MTTPEDIPIWRRELSTLMAELITEANALLEVRGEMKTMAAQASLQASADTLKVAAYRISQIPDKVRRAERDEEARSGH